MFNVDFKPGLTRRKLIERRRNISEVSSRLTFVFLKKSTVKVSLDFQF